MPRSDPHKWAKDTTRMLVAALADRQTGKRIDIVRAHNQYNPIYDRNERVRGIFAQSALPRVYDPQKDSQFKLICANPDCGGELHYVPKTFREGDLETNRSHFRSHRVSDHTLNCMFRNQAQESKDELSLAGAIAAGKPILVNINGLSCGHFAAAPKYFVARDQPPVSEYEQFLSGVGADGYHSISVHSVDELDAAIKRVDKTGGADALNLMWFNNSTMTVPYAQFRMESDEAWHTLLRQFVAATEEAHIHGRDVVQLGARLVDLNLLNGPVGDIYKPRDKRIGMQPRYLNGTRMAFAQNLFMYGRADDGVAQSERHMRALIERTGPYVHVMATPTLYLARDYHARGMQISGMRQALAREALISAINPFRMIVDWSIGKSIDKQIQPRNIARQQIHEPLTMNAPLPRPGSGARARNSRPKKAAGKPHTGAPMQLKLL